MPRLVSDTEQIVFAQLQVPHFTLNHLRDLFATLNYDPAQTQIPTSSWPAELRAMIQGAPIIFATAGDGTAFNVIALRLTSATLRLGDERAIIGKLIAHFPYALFVFSAADQAAWHLVNVRYDNDLRSRQVYRRITIAAGEHYRTAAERLSLLDVEVIRGARTTIDASAIQTAHDRAFNVEHVTKKFFAIYADVFAAVEKAIAPTFTAIPNGKDACRLFTQRLFNRLMFIAFIQKKGWLTFRGNQDYLNTLWAAHRQVDDGNNFYDHRLRQVFFVGLNTAHSVDVMGANPSGFLQDLIGDIPYLNGGLFEEDALDRLDGLHIPDAAIELILHRLFAAFNFTVTESTPLDIEVAVDPEMLGKVFEELVTGRHESGSYYTPKPVVAFMCREAVKGYLERSLPAEDPAAIAAFVDEHEPGGLRHGEDTLAALRAVTVCDPACGSGAYLLGMLHELLALREVLFATRRLDPVTVYQRKLEIIQQNLYGVDLDPFAVNIARLRLWLSLAVDLEGAPRPLPNLDYKLEVGDSLTIPLPNQASQGNTYDLAVADFGAAKAAYLRAHGPVKPTLKQAVEHARAEVAKYYPPRAANGFAWAVEFAEVLIDGGFAIIVANPPYVRQELIKDLKPMLKSVFPTVYGGTADLYTYFYARAVELLRPGGVLSFIAPNKWFRAGYGEKLRGFLQTQTAMRVVIDFADAPIFQATTYPSIVVAQKGSPPATHHYRGMTTRQDIDLEQIREMLAIEGQTAAQADGIHPPTGSPATARLVRKLLAMGTPLGDYVGGKMYYGIKTGLNEAFVVDQATRERLIAEDPRSAEVLKPFLRGRDIGRYQINSAGLWLICLPNGWTQQQMGQRKPSEQYAWVFLQKAYPAIARWLAGFAEAAKKRDDQGHYWWELRSCAYYEEFAKPKIIYPDMASSSEFTFESEGFLMVNTLYFMPINQPWLCGLLNSKPINLIYATLSNANRGGTLRFFSQYTKRIPIATPTTADQQRLSALVDALQAIRGEGPAAAALEAEIDAIVYRTYGLAADEVAEIERWYTERRALLRNGR